MNANGYDVIVDRERHHLVDTFDASPRARRRFRSETRTSGSTTRARCRSRRWWPRLRGCPSPDRAAAAPTPGAARRRRRRRRQIGVVQSLACPHARRRHGRHDHQQHQHHRHSGELAELEDVRQEPRPAPAAGEHQGEDHPRRPHDARGPRSCATTSVRSSSSSTTSCRGSTRSASRSPRRGQIRVRRQHDRGDRQRHGAHSERGAAARLLHGDG